MQVDQPGQPDVDGLAVAGVVRLLGEVQGRAGPDDLLIDAMLMEVQPTHDHVQLAKIGVNEVGARTSLRFRVTR